MKKNIIIRIPQFILSTIKMTIKWWLFNVSKNWTVLNRIHVSLRPAIWRLTGCNIGKRVSIGYDVYYDVTNASLINIEDRVWITSRCLIFCHKRDIEKYHYGDDVNKLPYIKSEVTIKKGAHIGMGSIIMPGVTIGEGSIIGAGSLVVKDIPPWSIACGSPAQVIRKLNKKD